MWPAQPQMELSHSSHFTGEQSRALRVTQHTWHEPGTRASRLQNWWLPAHGAHLRLGSRQGRRVGIWRDLQPPAAAQLPLWNQSWLETPAQTQPALDLLAASKPGSQRPPSLPGQSPPSKALGTLPQAAQLPPSHRMGSHPKGCPGPSRAVATRRLDPLLPAAALVPNQEGKHIRTRWRSGCCQGATRPHLTPRSSTTYTKALNSATGPTEVYFCSLPLKMTAWTPCCKSGPLSFSTWKAQGLGVSHRTCLASRLA